MDLLKIDRKIRQILREIPEIISAHEDLGIQTKSAYNDLVTLADQGVEEYLSERLTELIPGSKILGEESYDEDKEYSLKNLWVIDPIDGTTNFVKQGRNYCTILSYFRDGEPVLSYVYDAPQDTLYSIIKGEGFFIDDHKLEKIEYLDLKNTLISLDLKRMYDHPLAEKMVDGAFSVRVLGSSGLESIKVAKGETGAYANPYAGPWDFSINYLMAKELGLFFSTFDGESVDPTSMGDFIVCTPQIAEDLGLK